jgi:hypothetical protein
MNLSSVERSVVKLLWHVGRRCVWCNGSMYPQWWRFKYCSVQCIEEEHYWKVISPTICSRCHRDMGGY